LFIKRRGQGLSPLFFDDFDFYFCNTMRKEILNSKAFKLLSNKFVIASLVFVVWILFFDENSISRHLKDRRQLHELVQQKAYYQERIESDKQKYEELNRGKAELEKFAREQYYMSKPDEDVFIIEEVED